MFGDKALEYYNLGLGSVENSLTTTYIKFYCSLAHFSNEHNFKNDECLIQKIGQVEYWDSICKRFKRNVRFLNCLLFKYFYDMNVMNRNCLRELFTLEILKQKNENIK